MSAAEYDGDDLSDAVAIVECLRRDDMAGLRALVANADWMPVMVTLAKMVAVFLDEENVTAEHFRAWSAQVPDRQ